MQETFLVYFNKLKSGEQIENVRAFLYVTATNFIKKRFNEIQKQNDNLTELDDEKISVSSIDSKLDELSFNEISAYIQNTLNESEKELFKLRFIDEVKIKDIASMLNITPANCSIKITRLRRKLTEALKEYI